MIVFVGKHNQWDMCVELFIWYRAERQNMDGVANICVQCSSAVHADLSASTTSGQHIGHDAGPADGVIDPNLLIFADFRCIQQIGIDRNGSFVFHIGLGNAYRVNLCFQNIMMHKQCISDVLGLDNMIFVGHQMMLRTVSVCQARLRRGDVS